MCYLACFFVLNTLHAIESYGKKMIINYLIRALIN